MRARPGGPGSRIETIVCDVGDVVILFDRMVPARIERRFGLPAGSLLRTALKSPFARLATVGSIDFAEWRSRMCQVVPRDAVDEWLDYHGDLNLGAVELLSSARRAGLRLFFLSNATSRLWGDLAHHHLLDFADGVFCSADIGLAKPDPRVYRFVADSAPLGLARTLYVDDTPSWVEAGSRLGMYGHVYTTVDGLRRVLAHAGVVA
jgi:putative hydrolase of the HAD superfamily